MRFLPLALLAAVGLLFWVGLSLNPTLVPSPLIGQPAPAFDLPRLGASDERFTTQDLRGRVTMIHVWASWCVTCRAEHSTLAAFAERGVVPVIGFNYRDQEPAARRWLETLGNPYELVVVDADGRVGTDFGVYGTPETFIVDHEGIIRYKHVGPLTESLIESHIMPLLAQLEAAR